MAHTNRLIHQKSPYLLQHAHNPVDWHAWGEEAFARAREEDKPIFLSIGYSTCHWCHVMERESFENESVAAVLNAHFIPVKVDREERPDVDRIYMGYVQAATGSGGWPMSVWLTPDLHPFVGGTYFPPENRYGRPGFPQILEKIATAWKTERERIVGQSAKVLASLKEAAALAGIGEPRAEAIEECFQHHRRTFDSRLGGFGGAPKFPRPVIFNFLLRYHKRTGNEEALAMVTQTLAAMARGGMNDQLGGGFHRYSVDEYWFVPHFEKMLYDQAQLAVSYVEAFQVTQEETFALEARRILDYVLRDMTHPEGGFYSAEDADSAVDSAHPKDKSEGAFYIFSAAEVTRIVGAESAPYVFHRYGFEGGGNVHNDPHGEFGGRNILFAAHTVEETAHHFDDSVEHTAQVLLDAEAGLFGARSLRPRPYLDDKVLTGWNGLMISAFARAGAALEEPRYAEAARRAADFVVEKLMPEGALLRRFREGEAAIPAFLDDYAAFIQALLDLFETGFDKRDLTMAVQLAQRQAALFEDMEGGGFYSAAEGDASLVMRLKEDYDGAEPSANSVAAGNLLRLARITGRADFAQSAARLFHAFAGRMNEAPFAVPQLMAAYGLSLLPPKQIVVAGKADDARTVALLSTIRARFLPDATVLPGEALASTLAMTEVNGAPAAYVCENFTCQLPVSTVDELAGLLQ